jgi:hypothetical protein
MLMQLACSLEKEKWPLLLDQPADSKDEEVLLSQPELFSLRVAQLPSVWEVYQRYSIQDRLGVCGLAQELL